MADTKQQKRPGDVFTPRAATVNESMYVRRPKLEERLIDAIDANKYIVIHGESGNGKTWLYKRVFNDAGVHYDTVNLSTVINAGSLEEAFRQKLGEFGVGDKIAEETNASVGAKPLNIGVDHNFRTESKFYPKSPFVSLLQRIRYRANGNKAALVLDNFETIINNSEALNQLAALPDEQRPFFEDMYESLGYVQNDLDHANVILDGSWPSAVPQLQRALEDAWKIARERGYDRDWTQ